MDWLGNAFSAMRNNANASAPQFVQRRMPYLGGGRDQFGSAIQNILMSLRNGGNQWNRLGMGQAGRPLMSNRPVTPEAPPAPAAAPSAPAPSPEEIRRADAYRRERMK
jgi:hypothetical protein